jgi:hypothetical protein
MQDMPTLFSAENRFIKTIKTRNERIPGFFLHFLSFLCGQSVRIYDSPGNIGQMSEDFHQVSGNEFM